MRHVLAIIHGIVPDKEPINHKQTYDNIVASLRQSQLFSGAFPDDQIVGVEYCHRSDSTQTRDDQLLQPAQSFILDRVGHQSVETNSDSENHLLTNLERFAEASSFPLRQIITDPVKERLLLLGMSDAVFYSSQPGEDAVRGTVYLQVLSALHPFLQGVEPVKLHVIAHSLGVTVAFDFLFGLFAPPAEFRGADGPSFLKNSEVPTEAKDIYAVWRGKALNGGLTLGSFCSMAGQLPMLLQRSVGVIRKLAAGELLDPRNIGVRPDVTIPQWRSFYDRDDVLGFPSRSLFARTAAIEEYQVNSGNALSAHNGMWTNAQVIERTLNLIELNLQLPT